MKLSQTEGKRGRYIDTKILSTEIKQIVHVPREAGVEGDATMLVLEGPEGQTYRLDLSSREILGIVLQAKAQLVHVRLGSAIGTYINLLRKALNCKGQRAYENFPAEGVYQREQ